MPLAAKISARSGTSARGARTFNVVSDGRNGEVQKRPGLVFSEGYGGLGSGLIDSPAGLFSIWEGAVITDGNGFSDVFAEGTITEITFAGWDNLFITGTSDDGTTFCGYARNTTTSRIQALKFTETTLTVLSAPTGVTGAYYAYGISGDGNVVVGGGVVAATAAVRACKWVDTTVSTITTATSAWPEGGAFAANSDGSMICGHVLNSGVMRGFIQSNGTVSILPLLASPYGSNLYLYAVSSDGSHVGGKARNSGTANQDAILYAVSGGTVYIPDPGAVITGISQNGALSCGIYLSGESFYYTKGGATTAINASGTSVAWAYAISKYGNEVIGEVTTALGTIQLFRWNAVSGMHLLGRIAATGTGTGPAIGTTSPKGAGASSMGSVNVITQFSGGNRTAAIWKPD